MSELQKRVATAIIGLPIVIYVIYLGGPVYLALIAIFAVLGALEFFRILETKGLEPLKKTGIVGIILISVVAFLSDEYFMMILLTFSIIAVMVMQLGKKDLSKAITGISGTVFVQLYMGFLFCHFILLRKLGRDMADIYPILKNFDYDLGIFFVIFALITTFAQDTGAYFTGRAYGKHKLAPTVSPKKSIEGAIGGVALAVIVAIVGDLVTSGMSGGMVFPVWLAALLGFAIAVSGILGDLGESLIKRDAKVKDSGALLPGHGGVMDRVDALIFSVPVTYYIIKIYYYLTLGR